MKPKTPQRPLKRTQLHGRSGKATRVFGVFLYTTVLGEGGVALDLSRDHPIGRDRCAIKTAYMNGPKQTSIPAQRLYTQHEIRLVIGPPFSSFARPTEPRPVHALFRMHDIYLPSLDLHTSRHPKCGTTRNKYLPRTCCAPRPLYPDKSNSAVSSTKANKKMKGTYQNTDVEEAHKTGIERPRTLHYKGTPWVKGGMWASFSTLPGFCRFHPLRKPSSLGLAPCQPAHLCESVLEEDFALECRRKLLRPASRNIEERE